jgi:hypothetical protein
MLEKPYAQSRVREGREPFSTPNSMSCRENKSTLILLRTVEKTAQFLGARWMA